MTEDKLKDMNLVLPHMQESIAHYVPYVKAGNLVYVSGQGPIRDGEFMYKGKLGRELTVEEGYEASRMTAVNILAVLKEAAGDLDKVERIVSVHGYVNSTDDFSEQPQVIDGASDLLVSVFGDRGRHTRCAISSNSLPMNTAVEIEVLAMIRD